MAPEPKDFDPPTPLGRRGNWQTLDAVQSLIFLDAALALSLAFIFLYFSFLSWIYTTLSHSYSAWKPQCGNYAFPNDFK